MNCAFIAKKLALLLVQCVLFAWRTLNLTPTLISKLAFEGNAWFIYGKI